MRVNKFCVAKRFAPVALMPPAAFAVHQLRYWLAFRSNAGLELERTGHSYLHSVVPWMVLVLALVAGGFLLALGRAFAAQRSVSRFSLSFTALWLTCTGGLVMIYVTQELLEGLLATGHPGGLGGIFGFGGWWAIPSAACVGLVLAATFHGARWVLSEVAERGARERTAPAPAIRLVLAPRAAALPGLVPLAAGWSGRGPPR